MSCFDNLFKLTKSELSKRINKMDKSIQVSKLKKIDLLCMYFQLSNVSQPKTTKTTKSQPKQEPKQQPKSQPKLKKQETKEIILSGKKYSSIDAMNNRVKEINKLLNEGKLYDNELASLQRERNKIEDYIEFET